MSQNLIKHGIKVFALYCDYTGCLPRFEVYLGKDAGKTENSALKVVDRLINRADLI